MADLFGHVFVKMPQTQGFTSVFSTQKLRKNGKAMKKRILIVFWDHKNDDFVEKKDDLPEYFLTNEEQQNPKKSDLTVCF